MRWRALWRQFPDAEFSAYMVTTRTIVLAALLLVWIAACSGAAGDESSGSSSAAATPLDDPGTVTADEASTMTIAEVLRTDERLARFAELAESTDTTMPGTSWMDVWDMPPNQIGDDREGVTVFAPINEGFDGMERAIRQQLDAAQLDNVASYTLISDHYVHRLYPESEFDAGPVEVWRGTVDLSLDPLAFGGHDIVATDLRTSNGYVHLVDGVVISDRFLEYANQPSTETPTTTESSDADG